MGSAIEVCPVCEGTGWKKLSGENRVTRCDCRVQARSQRLLDVARIPRRHEHCELSNFEVEGSLRTLAAARLVATRFVEEYPVDSTGLLLVGSIGVGKTHLAIGIIKALIAQKGVPCVFFDYRELLKEVQNSYDKTVPVTELQLLRPVFETEVLVLDELGAVKPSEWVWDTLSFILNTRYNDNRTTIITTNFRDEPSAAIRRQADADKSPRTLALAAAERETLGDRIGDRMRSRLHEMCRKVEMQGDDFRQKFRSASFR